jgi:RimJ/RimL family protein N-acetyltransferase
MAHWDEHGFGRWAAEADGKLVGFGGVTVSKEFDGLNLSYHFHPDSWGKGYATELVQEALDLAFRSLKADRVIGLVRPANPASRRVLERTGFTFEQEVELHGAPTMLFALERPVYAAAQGNRA